MFIDFIKVFILSLVEGLTEFIPVSSTGHMIIVDQFLKLSNNKSFVNAFQIIIQLGAILAVVVYYWDKIYPFSKKHSKSKKKEIIEMWIKIVIAFLPSAIFGFLLDDIIEAKFFNAITVSIMLIFYGIILIFMENRKNTKIYYKNISQLPIKTAIFVGLFQCLAMIPGTSRSAATIIGGVFLGLSRILATEFSFFLAIPTMLGASTLKIIKMGAVLSLYEWFLISLGFVFSFIIAFLVIKVFLDYIKKNDFKIFGYYRIILGIIMLILTFIGVIK